MPMRQLRSCDFCGDDAAGVYEVLPPELSPTEAEQHRVVLCSDCRETLEGVIEPLLGRLDVDGYATEADSGARVADNATIDTGPSEVDSGSETADATGSPSAGAGTDGAVQLDDVDSTTTGSDEGDRSEPPVADTGRADIPSVEPDDDSGTTSESGSEDDGEAAGADPASEAVADDVRTPTQERGGVDDEPDEFRTVMRLLGNREFPVERAAIVDLAVSAYELDEAQVDRILDHAVDRGVLVDDDGTLERA